MPILTKTGLLGSLPPESALKPRPPRAKIVVLDDDPTGTQTVHDVAVLTEWTVPALMRELRDTAPCFYVLTNSRAHDPDRAAVINSEIGQNLMDAAGRARRPFRVVSRSDSTLRGHYPAETDALARSLGSPFAGTLIIPAFFAGGRMTVDDVHYVIDGERLTPAAETEFAKDASFGYRSSNLREWVSEKTAGRVSAETVVSVSIADLRLGGPERVASRLLALPRGGVGIINAAAPSDLAVLTHALAITDEAGETYLFRTAADFVAAFAGIEPQPLLETRALLSAQRSSGGLLVAGSYIGKTTAQLDALFARVPAMTRVEIDVGKLLESADRAKEIHRSREAVEAAIAAGVDVVLYTSRRLYTGRTVGENLAIGETVSSSLIQIVRSLETAPRWFVAKGGITSSDMAAKALGIKRAMILGQAMPGVPVWKAGEESKWPGMAYIVFPGNVGGPDALADLIERFAK